MNKEFLNDFNTPSLLFETLEYKIAVYSYINFIMNPNRAVPP